MFGINIEQIKSVVVKLLALASAYVVGKWGITAGTWEAITALVVAVFTVISSFTSNTATQIVKAAEGLDAVKSVKVTAASGIAPVTGPKVTT